MGGNVKDAFTKEPTEERDCENCGVEFEYKYKYPEKYCKSCKERWYEAQSEIEADLSLERIPDTRETKITVSLTTPNVPDSVPVLLPCERMNTGEFIIGLLRVQDESGEIWYEDAWVLNPRHSYHEGIRVKGERKWTTQWGGNKETPPKYAGDDWTSVRESYRSSVGDPFDTDTTLTAEFTFPENELGIVQDTATAPNYLIDL